MNEMADAAECLHDVFEALKDFPVRVSVREDMPLSLH